jgi:hypothetical protein
MTESAGAEAAGAEVFDSAMLAALREASLDPLADVPKSDVALKGKDFKTDQ